MTQIERITQMEERKNRAEAAVAALEKALTDYRDALGDIRRLGDYLAGNQWIKDFEADEAGRLPADLPRGVLSEDGIYDLLLANRDVQVQLAQVLTAVVKAGVV